jgi:hypothetical protein
MTPDLPHASWTLTLVTVFLIPFCDSGPGCPWGSCWSGPPQEDVGEALVTPLQLPHSNSSPWTLTAETIPRAGRYPTYDHLL